MKFPKIRIGEISPGRIGILQEPTAGFSQHYILEVPREVTGSEPWLQLFLAAPELLESLEWLLEHVDPQKMKDLQYNAAVQRAKRASLFARRTLNLESVLFRENFLDDSLRELSTQKGSPEPQTPTIMQKIEKFFGR